MASHRTPMLALRLRYNSKDHGWRYNITIPPQERYEVLAQAICHMTENVTLLPLFHDSEPVMINERLMNAGGRRDIGIQAWNAHEWDLR